MATKKKSARKASSAGASEEIREEMRAAKAGKLESKEQAIAIGLSKARRAGKDVPAPKKGTTSEATRRKALKDIAAGKAGKKSTAKKVAGKKAAKKSASKNSAVKRRS